MRLELERPRLVLLTRWAPAGTTAVNPVFDVTPAELVTALITERGVVTAPDTAKIAELVAPR